MEWAKELRKATEVRSRKTPNLESKKKKKCAKKCGSTNAVILRLQSCGVDSEELGKMLHHMGLKKKRLGNLLPLLEFITWSLLNEDSTVRRPEKHR